MSVRKTTAFTTSSRPHPAEARMTSTLRIDCRVCSTTSSDTTWPVLGSSPPIPEVKTQGPTLEQCENGPGGVGASTVWIRWMTVFVTASHLSVQKRADPFFQHGRRHETRRALDHLLVSQQDETGHPANIVARGQFRIGFRVHLHHAHPPLEARSHGTQHRFDLATQDATWCVEISDQQVGLTHVRFEIAIARRVLNCSHRSLP